MNNQEIALKIESALRKVVDSDTFIHISDVIRKSPKKALDEYINIIKEMHCIEEGKVSDFLNYIENLGEKSVDELSEEGYPWIEFFEELDYLTKE